MRIRLARKIIKYVNNNQGYNSKYSLGQIETATRRLNCRVTLEYTFHLKPRPYAVLTY